MAVRTISTKLAVEGESEYKQKISACNTELKTLKSSLSLVESEFKGNANSMEALTEKGKALSSMHEAQTKKIETLKAALENCQKAQETYSERVATAKENIERCEKALEELKGSTGDTTKEQEALTKELDKWNVELEDAQAGQTAAGRGVQEWQRQLNNAGTELNGLNEAIDKNDKYLAEAKNSTDGCAKSIDEFGNEVKDSKDGIESLAAALAAAGIAKTVKEIADALIECSTAAAGFETAMAKVSTLADTTVVPLDELKASLVTLSSETGVAVESLAEAAYQALSAGVDTANVVDFVSTATKLSVAGFTESATAVDVLTTALNAYGMESTEAESVASKLVKTQDLGKTTVAELAENMGKIIPTAAAYKVSIDNLTTSYALMTASGTNTRIATTNLTAMLDELSTTGGTVAKTLEEKTGKSFSDLMDSGKSLGDVIAILADSVDNDATAFSNLWSSSTAGKAALSLLNSGAEAFNETLAVMENSSGAVDRNFEIMADTTEHAQERMTTAAENLKIAIGDQLNPALEKLYEAGADAFTWATDFVDENPWIVSAIAGVTGAVAALSLGVAGLAAAPKIIMAMKIALDLLTANPIVAVAAAIVGVTVAIGAWVATSDDATASVKQLTEAASGLEDTIGEAKAACDETAASTLAAANVADTYIDKLEEMGDYAKLSAEDQQEYHNILAILCETVPELANYIDLETNTIIGGTDALRENTEAWKENAIAQAFQEEYTQIVSSYADVLVEAEKNSIGLTEAQVNLEAAQQKYNDALDKMSALSDEATEAAKRYNEENQTSLDGTEFLTQEYYDLRDSLSELSNEVADAEQVVDTYNEAIEKDKEATEAAKNEMALAEEAIKNLTEAQEDAVEPTKTMTDYVDGLKEEMAALQAQYDESYAAAKESIEGQLGLFNDLDGTAKTTIGDLIDTLKGQVDYMDTYAANIKKAMEMGVDEGLVKKLSDGSEESAQILAAIVEGGQEDIDALNEQLARVEEGKDNFSNAVADMETDFDDKMGELEKRLDQAIDYMDQYTEAKAAGVSTVAGYMDGADSMRSNLVSKYRSLALAANDAYKSALDIHSPSRVFREHGKNTVRGAIEGVEETETDLERAYTDLARAAINAYERALPSTTEEPSATAAADRQTAAIVSAVGAQQSAPVYQINVDKMEVRDDQDVQRVAQELYRMTQRTMRAKGGGTL